MTPTPLPDPKPDWPEIDPPEEIVRVTSVPCPACGSPFHYYCVSQVCESPR